MHLALTPDTNRVNPAELRDLRQRVAARQVCCLPTALQAEVSLAHELRGLDYSQEARVLLLEHEAAQARPTMQVAR
jgi:hypothetical protein